MEMPRQNGKFVSPYKEPRGPAITFRLSKSLYDHMIMVVGDGRYAPWIEQAVKEKLARS
jgi:hypothetical protein